MPSKEDLQVLRIERDKLRRQMIQCLGDEYNQFWENEVYINTLQSVIATLTRIKDQDRALSLLNLKQMFGTYPVEYKDIVNKHPSIVLEYTNNLVKETLNNRQDWFSKAPGLREAFERFEEVRKEEAKLRFG